jgi:predicted nucleic acid-binding protein
MGRLRAWKLQRGGIVKGLIPKWLLLDSGFWLGLYDAADSFHDDALRLLPVVERCHVLVPWPSMYEFLNTRMLKRKGGAALEPLRRSLQGLGVERIDDSPYRVAAVAECLDLRNRQRPMSLVDRVLRAIVLDPNRRVHGVVTFNPGDFADVCRKRQIELLPHPM